MQPNAATRTNVEGSPAELELVNIIGAYGEVIADFELDVRDLISRAHYRLVIEKGDGAIIDAWECWMVSPLPSETLLAVSRRTVLHKNWSNKLRH